MSTTPLNTALRHLGLGKTWDNHDPSEEAAASTTEKHGSDKSDEESHVNRDGVATPVVEVEDKGVTRIDALYIVFGKGWGVYSLWISIALIAYVYSLSRLTTAYYAQFATSSFGSHTIIGTIGVINSILGGIAPPFIAKIADLWSRPHALLVSVMFYAVGYAMCAGAKNVDTVVAGQFIYTIGNTGIAFLNSVIIADVTSLQWRPFADGAVNLPYVVNSFIAGYIVTGINGYSAEGWRWGYGMFVILLPLAMSPAIIVLLIGDHRAKKLGEISLAVSRTKQLARDGKSEEPKRTTYESFKYGCSRLNVIGLLLMGFAFGLLLTPITLSSTATGGYQNRSLIAMLAIGGVCFVAWVVWDCVYAAYPFMPRRVFNQTFIACVLADFFYYFSSYLVDGYFPSWVYVIVDWSDANYTFFSNTITVATCGFAVFFGLWMRYAHRYKVFQIGGLALKIIGMGLTYHATSNPSDAVLVLGRVFIGIGASVSIIASYIGVQGSVPHQDMAIATAVLNLWASMGSSISLAIASSVWGHQIPRHLQMYLGATHSPAELAEIFGSIYVARLAEPRELVKLAYLQAVKGLWLAGLIASFGSLIAACFAKNFYLGQAHNDVEKDKIVKFRNKEEIAEVIKAREEVKAAVAA